MCYLPNHSILCQIICQKFCTLSNYFALCRIICQIIVFFVKLCALCQIISFFVKVFVKLCCTLSNYCAPCQTHCTHTHCRLKNIHLAALYPCTYWGVDKNSGQIAKMRKKPSNLGPMLVCLANDLLHWYDGKMVTDYSRSEDDLGRVFLLRAVLLFWCGDYPGLGEATNFTHAGYYPCHWCKIRGVYAKGLTRMVYGRYRRYRARNIVHMYSLSDSYEFLCQTICQILIL